MLGKEKREKLVEKEMNELKDEKEKLKIDKKESIRMEQENNELIEKSRELKKDIDEKQKIYNQILQNIEKAKKDFQNLMNIKKTIINEYEEIKLVGLNNVGSIYIMNSVLQCLSQTKPLTDYFLNDKNIDRIINNNIAIKNNNELQLSPIYYSLIKQLWNKEGSKSIFPNNFMNHLEKMNPSFKQGRARDSKDFFIFILKKLHKELKSPIKGINQNIINKPLNQYDKNNSFNYFFNEFRKECSIISDIFFGFNEITNECINCKNIYNSNGVNNPIFYNYEIFNCLIFPLEKIKNYKNNKVSIYECFIYLNKSEIFKGENRYYCNICKSISDSVYIPLKF
jgi:ubiquitin C-terminal hydrolase